MKFSIVAAAYNEELYLASFLESVCNQTYTDYEVIIVDDGSTDSTGAICDKYQMIYGKDKIKVIHQENAGVLIAKRNALQHVSGEYVALVDSDDLLERNLLEEVAKELAQNCVDVVMYKASHLFKDGSKSIINDDCELFLKDRYVYTGEEKKKIYAQLIDNPLLHAMWCKVVKREIICKELEYQNLGYVSNGEDLLQTLAVCDMAEAISCINKSLYNYRVVDDGLSKKYSVKSYPSLANVYKVLEEYLLMWKMPEELPRLYRYFLSIAYDDLVRVIGSGKSSTEIKQRMQYIRQDSFYVHAVERLQGQAVLPTRRVMIMLLKMKCYGLLKGFLRYKELRKK